MRESFFKSNTHNYSNGSKKAAHIITLAKNSQNLKLFSINSQKLSARLEVGCSVKNSYVRNVTSGYLGLCAFRAAFSK
jgi:hypothetical protein